MTHYNSICALCGKFMSYSDMAVAIVWTPYGGYVSLEPPDDELAHRNCWEQAEPKRKELIFSVAWHKPYDRQLHRRAS